MKLLNSSYTGRSSRTLEEAFGPHTSQQISEPSPKMQWQDVMIYIGCSAVACFLVVLHVVGVVK